MVHPYDKDYRWRDASQRDGRPYLCSWRHLANTIKCVVTAVNCWRVLHTYSAQRVKYSMIQH